MPPEDERSGPWQDRPGNTSTSATITDWADTFEDAQRWVCWNGRRRWPDVALNDVVWAVSIADWATHGRRTAA